MDIILCVEEEGAGGGNLVSLLDTFFVRRHFISSFLDDWSSLSTSIV